MLQFQLATERDRREAAGIERRRAIEEERRKRIFNPRDRLYGNDYAALKQQIEEKQKLTDAQKRTDEALDDYMQKSDQIAIALARKEAEERKNLAREINNFRVNFQKFEDRREFDLNDPSAIKKALPARIHDNDPRIGISSAQKFEGEDVIGDERKKVQAEQLKSWLDQQIMEKDQADKERMSAENAYKAAVIARDSRAIELDVMEKTCRKHLGQACTRFNQALANERKFDGEMKKNQEKEDSMAHMYNIITSDMMTENPDVSLSNLGGDRRIGFLYKGMSTEEKKEFRDAQLAQIEEQRKRKAQEKRFCNEWDDYSNGIQKTVAVFDREEVRKEKERQKQLAEENKRLAEEQKNRKEYLDKIVYSNKPTAAFYDQFNRSTR